MTNREAIENLEGCIVSEEWKDGKPTGNITCDLTREILSMAIAALKRQEPVKPNDVKCDHIITGYCNMCGNYVNGTDNYCSDCGQRLDWQEDTKTNLTDDLPEGMAEAEMYDGTQDIIIDDMSAEDYLKKNMRTKFVGERQK